MTAPPLPLGLAVVTVGPPDFELLDPAADGLPYQVRLRLGPLVFESIEDPAYCRAVSAAWLAAAQALEAGSDARVAVAADLAPDPSGLAMVPGEVTQDHPPVHETAGPEAEPPLIDPDCAAGKHGSCVGGPCACICHPAPELPQRAEPHDCPPCQFGNHDDCYADDGRVCTCNERAHAAAAAETETQP